MAYILYTPDTERGSTAYTQHCFASLDELRTWIENEVMTPSVKYFFTEPAAETPEVKKPIDVSFIDDISSHFSNSNSICALRDALRNQEWSKAAEEYLHLICSQMFGYEGNVFSLEKVSARHLNCITPTNNVTPDEYNTIITLLRNLPVEDMFHYFAPQVDNTAFVKDVSPALQEKLRSVPYNFLEKNGQIGGVFITAKGPIVTHLLQISALVMRKRTRKSWGDIQLTYRDKTTPLEQTVQVCSDFIQGRMTEELREFLTALLFSVYYDNKGREHIIGSSALYNQFKELSITILPSELVAMIEDELSHSNIKHALAMLGIGSVRRAEGRKYLGLEQVTVVGHYNAILGLEIQTLGYMDEGLEPYDPTSTFPGSTYIPFNESPIKGPAPYN